MNEPSFKPEDFDILYDSDRKRHVQYFSETVPLGQEDVDGVRGDLDKLLQAESGVTLDEADDKGFRFEGGIGISELQERGFLCIDLSNGQLVPYDKSLYDITKREPQPVQEVLTPEDFTFLKLPENWEQNLYLTGDIVRR